MHEGKDMPKFMVWVLFVASAVGVYYLGRELGFWR